MNPRFRKTARSFWTLLLILTQLWWAGAATAQTSLNPVSPTQFNMIGLIQAATLDNPADPLSGGTITVNNKVIIVPKNTILQMPAAALTWQQVFAQAPLPYGLTASPPSTGLAMRDVPTPLGTYEVNIVGNRVGEQHIAGLMFLSQHSLQSGQGFINWIDYATGIFEVGGTIGAQNTGARVKINDPIGRFAPLWTPDQRFTIDEDNPTIKSESAYPMCIRQTPDAARCPEANRPNDPASPSGKLMIFTMPAVANVTPGVTPDPRLMAPFEIGDYVTYSGILVTDNAAQPTVALPAGSTAGTYIAAYAVTGNVGLFTAPGADPAYVSIDVMVLGVGGQTVAGLAEAATRTVFEGFTTDPSRNILLWAIDVDPCTGTETYRDWGEMSVDPGPPGGAVMGRWRSRQNTVRAPANGGAFLPPPREMRAVVATGGTGALLPDVNGLQAGQYTAPIFEYIFPENAGSGKPIVPNNFEDFPFLVNGSGPLEGTGPVVGRLDPWPTGFVTPPAPAVCPVPGAPVANAGPNQTVGSGTTVTLAGSATGTGPFTFAWTQTAGPLVTFLPSANVAGPHFTAPIVSFPSPAAVLTFQLQVTGAGGLASAASTVNITVNPSVSDVVSIGLVEYRTSKRRLTVDAASSFTPAGTARLTMQAFDAAGNPQGGPQNMPFIGGGIYEIILVGAPQPATVRVTSDHGGSAVSGITRLRQ